MVQDLLVTVAEPSTPPVLSGASATALGSTGIAWSVTTNREGGMLYWVLSLSATTPSAAQIQAGQTHTGALAPAHGTQSVAAVGTQNGAGAGLIPETTYFAHFLHVISGSNSNTLSSSGATTESEGTNTGSVALAVTRRMNRSVVPEKVWLKATISDSGTGSITAGNPNTGYDASWNDVYYVWDFDDAGAVSTKGSNLPTALNDLSKGGGREVCHVFMTTGTHNVTCTAYRLDGTRIGSNTISIVVNDTGTVYSGSEIYLVDSTGAGDSATYPGASVHTSPAAAKSAAEAAGGDCMILLRRGQSYNISTGLGLTGTNTSVYWGAWGTGANPVLNAVGGLSDGFIVRAGANVNGDVRFVDINFDGLWNAAAESGVYVTGFLSFQQNARNVLLSRCEFTNCGMGINFSDGPSVNSNPAFTVHDCAVDDWLDYGVYCGRNEEGSNQFYALIGGRIAQDRNALMGGNGKTNRDNQHGPTRIPVGHHVYVDGVDFFSRNSWPTGNEPNVPGIQPCIRLYTNNNYNDGDITSAVIRRCALESGAEIITVTSAGQVSGYTVGSALNVLIERCYSIGSSHTGAFVITEFGGLTVRDCIHAVPNVGRPGNQANKSLFIEFRGPTSVSYPGASWPVRAYNNTMVDFRAAGTYGGTTKDFDDWNGSQTNIQTADIANNIHWCPNDTGRSDDASDPLLSATAMATASGAWQSRFDGWRWDNSTTMDTSKATPDSLGAEYRPGPGSPAIGDANTGTSSPFDFGGIPRGANRSRGACTHE